MTREYDIEYLGGHPLWSSTCKASICISSAKDRIWITGRGLLSQDKIITILKEDLVDVSFERNSSRSAGKTVAGALIGGALTGGIGLLVGGAIGARKKDQTELYITYLYNGRQFVMVLKTGKHTGNIYSEINSLFI